MCYRTLAVPKAERLGTHIQSFSLHAQYDKAQLFARWWQTAVMRTYYSLWTAAALTGALQPPRSASMRTLRCSAAAQPDLCFQLLKQVNKCNDLGDGVALLPLVVDCA